jgi:trimeric autotransporter adhesin
MAIRTGTARNDALFGTAGSDSLFGSTGDDRLWGVAGNDRLDGGVGADVMRAGAGNDVYIVDNARDVVVEGAGLGIDTVNTIFSTNLQTKYANVENLVLRGAARLNATGNAGANTLVGNSVANTLDGAGGGDLLIGGLGYDTYIVDHANDVVVERVNSGIDTVWAHVSFTLGLHIETLILKGTGDINGTGNAQANRILGNEGANTLNGGGGKDQLYGGVGDDIYIVDGVDDLVVEVANAGTDTVRASLNWTLADHFENLELLGTALNGTGNGESNGLVGNAGNNQLDGRGGADKMTGGDGDDVYVVDRVFDGVASAWDEIVEGVNAGSDTIQSPFSVNLRLYTNVENVTLTGTDPVDATGDAEANVLIGNSGDNTLSGDDGSDTLNGGGGNDTLIGGGGNDTYIVDSASEIVIEMANQGVDTLSVNFSVELANYANFENVTLLGDSIINATGNGGNNVLTGNSAANILSGGEGEDQMEGRGGDDVYIVDVAGDVVTEAAEGGMDTVRAQVTYTLGDHVENLELVGTDNLGGTGNALNNRITGNGGTNRLNGGAGSDDLIGGAGDDTYVVDHAGDKTTELAGLDVDLVESTITWALAANIEKLTLLGGTAIDGTGNELANTILGNSAINILKGGAGDDRLNGSEGNDILLGEAGNDTFEFSTALNSSTNVDMLFFTSGDSIELDNDVFTSLTNPGALAAGNFFVIGNGTQDADDFILYDRQTGALYYDADSDGDGIRFAILQGQPALAAVDFEVID